MSRRGRLAATAAALLLQTLVMVRWLSLEAPFADGAIVPELPARIGSWSLAAEHSLSGGELDMLAPDAYLARRYDWAGLPIWVYIAMYGGQRSDGKGAHDPLICYPAQGWEVVSTRRVKVPLPGGESFVGNLAVVQQGRAEQVVLYWFQPADRWAGRQSLEQLARIWDAISGRPQFAFVRLAIPSLPERNDVDELLDFARRISGPVRESLSARGPALSTEIATDLLPGSSDDGRDGRGRSPSRLAHSPASPPKGG
jgi:EpsI family protein